MVYKLGNLRLEYLLLGAVDEQPLAEGGLEGLLAGLTSASTEDKLGPELPVKRDVPCLSSLLVDDRVVVLEIGPETFSLEGNPEGELVHGVGMLGPVTVVVGVDGDVLAESVHWLGVLIEQNLFDN